MIQPVMALSLSVSAVAAATVPTLAAPPAQSQMAQPTTATIRRPFRTVRTISMMVKSRISRAKVWRVFSIASFAYSISRS